MDWKVALEEEMQSWKGTKYSLGQRLKGVGVDCVQFVIAVLDEMYGYEPIAFRAPSDSAVHDRRFVMASYAFIAHRYPQSVLRGAEPDTGDVVILRHRNAAGAGRRNPGHVGIVGMDRRVLWHADSPVGVCTTSVRAHRDQIVRVWRMTGKEQWSRRSSS